MTLARPWIKPLRAFAYAIALAIASQASASADLFQLDYSGTFSTADALNLAGSPTTPFVATTPFEVSAVFDTSGANIVAPVGVAGFVAYSPITATLTVGGVSYAITSYDQDPIRGLTVAIFDDTTPFNPGRFAVGMIANPLADGAGFVGDWSSSTPTFSAGHLVPTTFTGYNGVGYGSGPDPHNGNPPAIVPIPLTDPSGQSYLLTLGNYEEQFAQGSPLNTAQIRAVPEPGSLALIGLGMGCLGVVRRRARVATGLVGSSWGRVS